MASQDAIFLSINTEYMDFALGKNNFRAMKIKLPQFIICSKGCFHKNGGKL